MTFTKCSLLFFFLNPGVFLSRRIFLLEYPKARLIHRLDIVRIVIWIWRNDLIWIMKLCTRLLAKCERLMFLALSFPLQKMLGALLEALEFEVSFPYSSLLSDY